MSNSDLKEKENIVLGQVNITPLLKSYKVFVQAIQEAKSDLERDGAIQRFEFTYELVWKTLKKILAAKGVVAESPRETFRLAAKNDLIENVELWFDFLKKRNLTVYTYDQECAGDIFKILPEFEKEVKKVIDSCIVKIC